MAILASSCTGTAVRSNCSCLAIPLLLAVLLACATGVERACAAEVAKTSLAAEFGADFESLCGLRRAGTSCWEVKPGKKGDGSSAEAELAILEVMLKEDSPPNSQALLRAVPEVRCAATASSSDGRLTLAVTDEISAKSVLKIRDLLGAKRITANCGLSAAVRAGGDCALSDGRILGATQICRPDIHAFKDAAWFKSLHASQAWKRTESDVAVIVAVLDSGADVAHKDLRDVIRINTMEHGGRAGEDDDGNGFVDDVSGWNFADDSNDLCPLENGCAHGTQVAGVIAQLTSFPGTKVSILPVRTKRSVRGQDAAPLAKAIVYAVKAGADIINISVTTKSDPLKLLEGAVQFARQEGVLVVTAIGDQHCDIKQVSLYPQTLALSYPNVLAVQAASAGYLGCQSNYASGIVLPAAPIDELCTTQSGGGWASFGESSAAAPILAGIAAMKLTDSSSGIRKRSPDVLATHLVAHSDWVPQEECNTDEQRHRLIPNLDSFLKGNGE